MSYEVKEKLDELHRVVGDFVRKNNQRLDAIEAKGKADPLLEERVDRTNADISRLQKEIDALIKHVKNPGGFGGIDTHRHNHEGTKAFGRWIRSGREDDILELKAMSTDSDPDGGFILPEEMEYRINSAILDRSPIRRLSRVDQSYTSAHAVIVNRGGTSSGWVGEKDDRPETDTSQFAEITITPGEMFANPRATQRVLDDGGFDVAAWIESEIVTEFSRREGVAFLTGNGVKMPKGILDYDTVANSSFAWGKIGFVPTGAVSTFTNPDVLIELQHALNSFYRNGAVFLMSDSTQEHIRKMKDGEGNYIWRPGLEIGAPAVLLGKPVEIDDNMPSIGEGEFPVIFGNLREAYTIVDRTPVRVLRDPYTQRPYVLFYATKRVGAAVTDYRAIKLLKVAST